MTPTARGLSERLVLGCARLTGGASAREAEALVRTALDAGIGHIDTAPGYGMGTAEVVVGRALRGFGGQVRVTAKLGSARDPLAVAKSLLRRAKRALAGGGGSVWDHGDPPPARIAAHGGHDFRRSAMQASLDVSRERLGRIDVLLLHDVSVSEADAALLADLAELAASVSAAPGYASHAQWDADLDARFPSAMVAQYAVTPAWLTGAAPGAGMAGRPEPFLHSVVKAGAAQRLHSAGFSAGLDRAARIVGTGDGDADRIAALYAAIGTALPHARLIIASSHRHRLAAVLRAIARIDAAASCAEIAAALAGPGFLVEIEAIAAK